MEGYLYRIPVSWDKENERALLDHSSDIGVLVKAQLRLPETDPFVYLSAPCKSQSETTGFKGIDFHDADFGMSLKQFYENVAKYSVGSWNGIVYKK